MRDTYKKYRGLQIPKGAEDTRYQRAITSAPNACIGCRRGWSEVRCGGISCTDCILHRGNDKVADTYYTFKAARTFRGLFVPEAVDEDYIPRPADKLLPGYRECRLSTCEMMCYDRTPSLRCEDCILSIYNVEVASTFFKNNNNKKDREMKSKLITYDRIFELPSAMLSCGLPPIDPAKSRTYAIMLTIPASNAYITGVDLQSRISQELDYESYIIRSSRCSTTVVVPFSTEICAKNSLYRINKWAANAYPAEDSENSVLQFCGAIDACVEGLGFALQFESMAEVWDAMVDQERWEYLAYVIGKLMDPKWGDSTKVIKNSKNLDNIRILYTMRNKKPVEYWRTSFSPDFLKNLNPFKSRE